LRWSAWGYGYAIVESEVEMRSSVAKYVVLTAFLLALSPGTSSNVHAAPLPQADDAAAQCA
jgi:hypothetical protein